MAVIRLDRSRLAKAKRTPQGFARVDARLTRTGILEYTRADGSIQREYRPADEVFRADSLASLELAPVTDLHPSEMISAANARALSIGVAGAPRRDGSFIAAELVIQDAAAIAKVDAGERAEISCGYACDLDETPGEFEGQRYDAIQRNIVYNHVAIGPRNWGRAGTDVAMRLDSADVPAGALVSRFDADPPVGETGDNPAQIVRAQKTKTMKIKNVEIKLDERDEALIAGELAEQSARADAAEQRVKELQTAAGAAAVQLQTATARADAAEAKVAKADRVQLEADARVALGSEAKFDGKSDAEVRAAVVAKMLPGMRLDSVDAAYVAGAFAAAMDIARKASESLQNAGKQSGAAPDGETRTDSRDERAKMIEERRKLANG